MAWWLAYEELYGNMDEEYPIMKKREDEQEFARLNGENLMFVEDAGRRIKNSLDKQSRFDDFWVRIEHHESLHAHDAVGVFTKGVENGYLPIP